MNGTHKSEGVAVLQLLRGVNKKLVTLRSDEGIKKCLCRAQEKVITLYTKTDTLRVLLSKQQKTIMDTFGGRRFCTT